MENKNSMNIVLAVVIVLAVFGVLVYISIHNSTNNNMHNMNMNNTSATSDDTMQPAAPTPSDTSAAAQTGDTVSVNYTGKLADGTVFDSNVDPKFNHVTPFIFTLGAGQVIPGWDKGIVGMTVGEKKTLVIPPSDAYGANGIPGTIPPNATLTFDVELLAINPSQQ